MKAVWLARCSISISGAAALLASCGGSQATVPIASSVRSWMSPAAKSGDLLYVSTYSFAYGSTVYVFSYPALSLIGQIDVGALGMCSDKNGNIYGDVRRL